MQEIDIILNYGETQLKAAITAGRYLGELRPAPTSEIANLEHEINYRLKNPSGMVPLASMVKANQNIAIVIPDQTRIFPTEAILAPLVNYMIQAGATEENITIVIGVGNHRPATEKEKRDMLGTLYGRFPCLNAGETGYKLIGITGRGTPVEVAKPVSEAELVIALGNIELHQLAGFSGGVKAVAAGTASRRALEHNHRFSKLQKELLGVIDDNVVRQDMEEFARIANLKFIVNTILNEERKVVDLVVGDPVEAHRAGAIVARNIFSLPLKEPADIVIVSPGGSPKDDTVYQTQKSLRNALKAVKGGGIVILTAKCCEGFGDSVFEQWMTDASNPEDLKDRTSKEFVLGGHKSAFIAEAVSKAQIFMVSDMSIEDVKKLFFVPFNSLQAAIDQALFINGDAATILVMPWGSLTVPV